MPTLRRSILTPPDAGPAFANWQHRCLGDLGSVLSRSVRPNRTGASMINASEITKTNSFYIANRDFAKAHGPSCKQIIDVTVSTAKWAETPPRRGGEVAERGHRHPLDIQTVAANRSAFAVGPITEDIIATTAGRRRPFLQARPDSRPVVVRDAVMEADSELSALTPTPITENHEYALVKRAIAVAVLSMSTAPGRSRCKLRAGQGGSQSASRNTASWCCSRAKARSRTVESRRLPRWVWTEFPSGPPLLEALNVGAIDFGNTGEAPPIFAQPRGAPIQYVAL